MTTKGFRTEPIGYEKTALSDLQGCWMSLKDSVVENFGFPDSDKLLFHIEEAMSWESVRNLKKMEATLLLIHNIIAAQTELPTDVVDEIEEVRQCLKDVFDAIAEGDV